MFDKIDWPKAIVAMGVDERYLRRKHGPCPICKGADSGSSPVGDKKKKSKPSDRFRFDDKNGMGTWFCHHCGSGNGYTLIIKVTGKTPAEVLRDLEAFDPLAVGPVDVLGAPIKLDPEFTPEEVAENRRWLNRAWAKANLRSGSDLASVYLRKRVPLCDLSALSNEIRIHPGMKFFEYNEKDESVCLGTFPTMLARVVDGIGTPITLHRTYLTPEGTKAPFKMAKKQMAGIRKLRGAAIRLNDVAASRTLGVTEGIETGYAVMTGYRNSINVWSFLNCGNLAVADIPRERFDMVIIFADHDAMDASKGYRPGTHYAEKLKVKLEAEGFEVEIRLPKEEGTDYADVWATICSERRRKFLSEKNVLASPFETEARTVEATNFSGARSATCEH